jgi:hypothetical protein
MLRGMAAELFTFSVPVTGQSGRFKAIAYSGEVIKNFGAFGDVAIDLSSVTFNNPVPVLADHANSLGSIVGSANLSVEDDALVAVGKINRITDAGKMVAGLMEDDHPIQLSVGIGATARRITVGEPVSVNGRSMKVAAVFENATIRELSFVAVAADPRTSAHLFNKQEHDMPDVTQEIEQLRAELAEEKARNAALAEELGQIKEKFAAKIKAERELSLKEFTLTDEAKTAMLGMTDEQFTASLSLALSLKKAAQPEHLFRDTATSGKPPEQGSGDGPLTAAMKAKYRVAN